MKKFISIIVIISSTILFANSAEEITKNNGCMACHNIIGKKAAPALKGTARKNLKWYGGDAKAKIINSIKNGSKGKYRNFADTQMPAFKSLSDKELSVVADWILSLYLNRTNERGHPQGDKKVNRKVNRQSTN